MTRREGFVPEEFLGQIMQGGRWVDYARGTEQSSKMWAAADVTNRRVVDWIDKHRVIFPEPEVDHLAMRQDADGTVYLGYFDVETQAAFCWSGDTEQSVEVSYGGMGEPVADTFRMHLGTGGAPIPLPQALTEFKRQCEKHLITRSRKDS